MTKKSFDRLAYVFHKLVIDKPKTMLIPSPRYPKFRKTFF